MLGGLLGRVLPAVGIGSFAYGERAPNSVSNRLRSQLDSQLFASTKPKTGGALPAAQKVDIGQGQLAVTVRVQDERVLTATNVTRQPSNLKVSAGATSPEGAW